MTKQFYSAVLKLNPKDQPSKITVRNGVEAESLEEAEEIYRSKIDKTTEILSMHEGVYTLAQYEEDAKKA